MNCIFDCVAADKEVCERFKDVALFGKEVKVKEQEDELDSLGIGIGHREDKKEIK
jgi:hypothetical protein